MADPFIGEIRRVAFKFAPKGWLPCDGRILSIQNNQALYALLGATYGGNGVTTFALPDLRGRSPIGVGSSIPWGAVLGEESHALTQNEMPMHTHQVTATNAAAAGTSPAGAVWAQTEQAAYGTGSATTQLRQSAVTSVGANQRHENRPPFLVVNYIIATQGIFPSRN
ncbi:tail fiber protein [Agromyces sp. NBRC 114283]|uniref:phage tail protein n=1 Tax=Agromyces sp. NBRC 114283 TaxID=2994521 RepID=UPI0024A509C5|nr:tail fiber protein [Agromyces sp. NBRC 114283]GLU88311.1 tail Collar domain-containing protein [Agromyces sp. NBRC 114283]